MFVNICPEGTRMPEDQIGRFGQSAAILAQEAGVDILPVTHNAGRFWKRRGVLKRPGKIKVIIGAPISGNNKHYHELTKEVKDWISTNKPN
jgi:1-acyl-sn-glycerol-3-phosphate acyltransferase